MPDEEIKTIDINVVNIEFEKLVDDLDRLYSVMASGSIDSKKYRNERNSRIEKAGLDPASFQDLQKQYINKRLDENVNYMFYEKPKEDWKVSLEKVWNSMTPKEKTQKCLRKKNVRGVKKPSLKERKASTSKMNLNLATEEDLIGIMGVSKSIAAAIVAYRTQKGKISSVNELAELPRIGKKTIENIELRTFISTGKY